MNRSSDPLMTFRFRLEIDGINIGRFAEVSGISAETEMHAFREGGLNTHEHQVPKASKFPALSLKRGMADSTELWDWYKKTLEGTFERKNGSIYLEDPDGKKATWSFTGALPTKWEGPSLNAKSPAVAIESLTLVHQGLKRDE